MPKRLQPTCPSQGTAFAPDRACCFASFVVRPLVLGLPARSRPHSRDFKPAAPLRPSTPLATSFGGDAAFEEDALDVRHTVVGALLNFGAMMAWSAVYELLPTPRSVPGRVAKAAAVTAAAYVTDYHVVPKRFTPGFEARLSPGALGGVYAALALGFLSGDEPR